MPSSKPLANRSLLILLDDEYEDLQFWYPKLRLLEAEAKVTVAGPPGKRHFRGKHGYPATSDEDLSAMKAADFDGVIIPGGWAPDKLRRDPHVLMLVREFYRTGKLIAAICHGGWIPISAGVYQGVRVTGSLGIKDDLINVGAVLEGWRRWSSIGTSSPAAGPTTCRPFVQGSSKCWRALIVSPANASCVWHRVARPRA